MIPPEGTGAAMALNPLRYEAVRDAQSLAVEKEQEREDKADRQSREAERAEKAAAEIAREKIRARARDQVALEQAVKFERQKVAYDQRQGAETIKKEREAGRSEYMKTHDPLEYARDEKDKARRQEWFDRNPAAPENAREKSDAVQAREPSKWENAMSDRARALVQRALDRDALEREDRDRSER